MSQGEDSNLRQDDGVSNNPITDKTEGVQPIQSVTEKSITDGADKGTTRSTTDGPDNYSTKPRTGDSVNQLYKMKGIPMKVY